LNYYPFHLGDYATHAGHLDPIEDCAYRRLIDLYMLTEQPLPLDVDLLARKIRMKEYAAAVRDVLNEFFTQTDDAWTHSRCDREIAAFRRASDNASRAGKASALSRKATTVERPLNGCATTVQPTKIQEPRTKNQEPRKDKTKEGHPALVLPDWMPDSVWQEWRQHRKAIRKPLTAGAEDLTLRKRAAMHDAGHDPIAVLQTSIANGWTGVFEPAERAPPSAAQRSASAADRQAEAIYRITGGLAGKPSTDERVIDVESFRQRQLAGR
jgi:uncharacterized protein YdaU (DUF1376 family)